MVVRRRCSDEACVCDNAVCIDRFEASNATDGMTLLGTQLTAMDARYVVMKLQGKRTWFRVFEYIGYIFQPEARSFMGQPPMVK